MNWFSGWSRTKVQRVADSNISGLGALAQQYLDENSVLPENDLQVEIDDCSHVSTKPNLTTRWWHHKWCPKFIQNMMDWNQFSYEYELRRLNK